MPNAPTHRAILPQTQRTLTQPPFCSFLPFAHGGHTLQTPPNGRLNSARVARTQKQAMSCDEDQVGLGTKGFKPNAESGSATRNRATNDPHSSGRFWYTNKGTKGQSPCSRRWCHFCSTTNTLTLLLFMTNRTHQAHSQLPCGMSLD